MSKKKDKQPTGVVLAGGLSSRMGNDKAAIHLFGKNEPDMLIRACRMLNTHIDEVWISGRNPHVRNTEFLWVPDEIKGIGPIGGIMSALRAAQGPILVLSCDLPFMDNKTIKNLLHARGQRPKERLMTTYMQQETGYIEALVAIYEFASLPLFEKAVENRQYKISNVIPRNRQLHLSYSGEESLPFFNVNYPADLEMARRIIGNI